MNFNSIEFLILFVCFFFLYWVLFKNNLRLQNILLLVVSHLFYGWFDWRFSFFLICVSAINFILGIYIEKANSLPKRRSLLYIGLILGIGGLAFLKYFNFFITSFNEAFQFFGINNHWQTINILLPLGVSFYTFRTISYLLDIDKTKIKATTDWVVFFNYVSFFPSLLSGPIDKASYFIPQLQKKRIFSYDQAVDGMRQILWGLFKKVVIADNCAIFVNQIFYDHQDLPGSTLLLGAFLNTIQIYADFSGYSDMAIGLSRLIGFNITKNFDFPFFAQNIAEFWRKWHISLTSWLSEYLFTPLSIAFRNYGKLGLILAIIINFTIIGIWHGANWTYVLFGFLHGCLFIPLVLNGQLNKKMKIKKNHWVPSLTEFVNMLFTFSLLMISLIIFSSESIVEAFSYYNRLFSLSFFSMPILPAGFLKTLIVLSICLVMLLSEWFGKDQEYAIAELGVKLRKPIRWLVYYALIFAIFYFQDSRGQQFIYFQF